MLSARPMYYLGQMGYYELNIDYIIETYCVNVDKPELQCNGKCHLAKQLQIDASTSGEDDANSTALVLECFYPVFNALQDYTFIAQFQAQPLKTKIDYYSNAYAFLHEMSLEKPPNSKV
ncbi:hypothetical protein HC176_14595 [Tamlana crocina]|uniref:Uncharacterized protein n=1 Tax=Tamlana crocina TaxID=393006 RepID=A0ABX1DGT0_9FLAO|nr:hypothetical protein [Tamlana crocina]